jgi:hypothetical protein
LRAIDYILKNITSKIVPKSMAGILALFINAAPGIVYLNFEVHCTGHADMVCHHAGVGAIYLRRQRRSECLKVKAL